jgi:hypothetical protein
MTIYRYETLLATTGDLLALPGGQSFEIEDFQFVKVSQQEPLSCTYQASFLVDAANHGIAVAWAGARMQQLEDSLAFYFSMPFVWHWWLWLLRREGNDDGKVLVSLYQKESGVVMEEFDSINQEALAQLMHHMDDDKFSNALYYYNALCRIDTIEYLRSHLASIFQLIESVAEEESIEASSIRAAYVRPSRKDMESFLGKPLLNDLYNRHGDGEDTARNATMHGNPHSSAAARITNGHIEEVLKKVRAHLITKFGVQNVDLASERVDIARHFYSWRGAVRTIVESGVRSIADYYDLYCRSGMSELVSASPVADDW